MQKSATNPQLFATFRRHEKPPAYPERQQIDGRAVVFDCYSSAAPVHFEGQFVWREVDGSTGCQLCGGYSGTFAE